MLFAMVTAMVMERRAQDRILGWVAETFGSLGVLTHLRPVAPQSKGEDCMGFVVQDVIVRR